MQTASRSREADPRSFAARKGHLHQLSISDDSRHVTEAIGYMYEDEASPTSPLANRNSYRSDKTSSGEYDMHTQLASASRKPLPERKVSYGERSAANGIFQPPVPPKSGLPWDQVNKGGQVTQIHTGARAPSDTATTQFPLNDIDYESSPAAVAQELSNLQALRRMSMDVAATGDPDLPQLNTAAIPSPPSPTSSEDDSARLFWVPARLHPELAPKEFKTFLESKAEQIKRRSGELSSFGSTSPSRSSSLSTSESSSSLRRKRSMLSRQIDNSIGYQDGADRLERKRSLEHGGSHPDPNLQQLESAMPRTSLDSKIDEETGDIILPSVPGSTLKRSTRTKYQRSDSRRLRGDGGTYAQRAAKRAAAGGRESPTAPLDSDVPPLPSFNDEVSNLASTLKDPSTPTTSRSASNINFSRPAERSSTQSAPDRGISRTATFESILAGDGVNRSSIASVPEARQKSVQSPPLVGQAEIPIPQIIESPPPEDRPVRTSSMRPPPTNVYTIPSSAPVQSQEQPEEAPKTAIQRPSMPTKQSSIILTSGRRSPNRVEALPPQTTPSQPLEQPSPLPGHETHTANLSYVPTLNADRRGDTKKKEEKKSSWSWLLGEKERDKEKDAEKPKAKVSKPPQAHDGTRLDVLQTSIDGGSKGRESLVLDRDSLRLDDDRKKESHRKTSSSSDKKEKESIFSAFFSGRKKADKEAQRRMQERLSPEPRFKELRPDVDYNWTRFSILEERAIYRMAHIKLANPRRALYSQVLLSNFMYSYLAKVQQMHPQMNLPTSAKQQRKQKEQEKQQQQPEEFAQYQRYQQQQAQQQQNSEQHQQHQHPNQAPQQAHYSSQPTYDGDASAMYDYEYATNGPQNYVSQQQAAARPKSRGNKQITESGSSATDHGDYGGGVGAGNSGSNSGGAGYNDGFSAGGDGNAYYHQQQQPRAQQQLPLRQQGRQNTRQDGQQHGRHDEDDDDDDDMW